ncbi:hypothetical protein [Mycobacterium sp. 29Ha]|uniref:8-oxoguanine DNA glycosylase OGG fold protein n=1 Tax=Mycobacterium sp. 29Ha TaxID=2939268 RepID=UPI002938DCAD|nr:hypothetical protein [Mycobacterium sp. 29Ha]MDV3133340.1 hypothetical protein [Mycobacterium sp. 29Ha]
MSVDVPELFDGAKPPEREQFVLNQGFTRDLGYCRGLLPDTRMWPAELDHLATDNGRGRIARRTLFEIAERATTDTDPWAAIQLHAAIVFWGAPPGQSMVRAVRPFAEDAAAQRFTQALALVRGEGAESAYKALSRRGRLWIANLGPSYFTKFLYFGGYGAKAYMPQPLIMDDNVISALKDVTKKPWEASAADYMRYLDTAADWAFEFNVAADVIERRLFQIGEE